MIGRLKRLLDASDGTAAPAGKNDAEALHLAAAALLVEAAFMDGHMDANERATIERLLGERFSLDGDEARALLADGETLIQETGDLYKFTRTLKDAFDAAERVQILEMLWEVTLADGAIDHFESNLIRRISGLLYVSDRESGEARQRVKARLGQSAGQD